MPYADPTLTTTYQGLCTAVADTLNRADLATGIPNFVAMATARLSRDMARLRHPAAIVRAQATATDNYVPLPQDFIASYQMMDQATGVVLDYVSPDASKTLIENSATVAPDAKRAYYTILGKTLRIYPPPGASSPDALDLWYYASLPALGSVNASNWALEKYPDAYLYASLVHSAPYLKADERLAVWEGAYQKILQDIEIEADRATRSQSKLVAARKSF